MMKNNLQSDIEAKSHDAKLTFQPFTRAASIYIKSILDCLPDEQRYYAEHRPAAFANLWSFLGGFKHNSTNCITFSKIFDKLLTL